MAKPQTTWYTPDRNGNIVNAGNFNFVDNLGNSIVDNSQNQIVTTIYQYIAKPSTLWSNSIAFYSIQDEMKFFIEDEMGNPILNEMANPGVAPDTQWFTSSRRGSIAIGANLQLVDNLGNSIVTNIQDNLVTTPQITVKQPSTNWTQV